MPKAWGEFEEDKADGTGFSSAVVKFLIMKAMEVDSFCGISLPSPDTSQLLEREPTFGLEFDDRVRHSAKLMHYREELEDALEAAKNQVDAYLENPSQEPLILPPIPDLPYHPVRPIKDLTLVKEPSNSDFALGRGLPMPRLDPSSTRSLLTQAVKYLIQLAGSMDWEPGVLEILHDAAEKYMKNMVAALRMAVDRGANEAITGFPDAMERVFAEMGIGSVVELHTYYKDEVLIKYSKLKEQCGDLAKTYNNLALSVKSGQTFETQLEEPDSVPEIHFPAMGEDGLDELQPSLETGLQMLDSLEQQVQLQQLDSQEGSPGQDMYDGVGARKRKRL